MHNLLPLIPNLSTIWRWLVSFTPRALEGADTYWIGGWLGPRDGLDRLDVAEKIKSLVPKVTKWVQRHCLDYVSLEMKSIVFPLDHRWTQII
jgi:hypothetical protein